jgi:hypothetical protein
VLQELEDQGGGNLIGRICDAEVKEWQLGLNGITLNQLELVLITKLIHTLRDLSGHARIDFHSYSLFASLQ